MTETRRLYYEDVYKKEFTATVVECREQKKGYAVILDESAFYPEGGGQPSDVPAATDRRCPCRPEILRRQPNRQSR